jgi:DNA (cytosine-5)-methyltransferase 1
MGVDMTHPILLDLFCCAGGCSVGYHRAGFDVVGVDIEPQKNYPFEFIQADVMEWLPEALESGYVERFSCIHASPPCQAYSRTKSIHGNKYDYPDLVKPTRELLIKTGKPYVIENVPDAPLDATLYLCGSMFDLPLIRHRVFETNPTLWMPPGPCRCSNLYTNSSADYSSFANGATAITVGGHNYPLRDGAIAMGIDWMSSRSELSQAIPPAYSEFIGRQMRSILKI